MRRGEECSSLASMRINKKHVTFLINYHPNNGFSSQIKDLSLQKPLSFHKKLLRMKDKPKTTQALANTDEKYAGPRIQTIANRPPE
jgi:hypothetical protein